MTMECVLAVLTWFQVPGRRGTGNRMCKTPEVAQAFRSTWQNEISGRGSSSSATSAGRPAVRSDHGVREGYQLTVYASSSHGAGRGKLPWTYEPVLLTSAALLLALIRRRASAGDGSVKTVDELIAAGLVSAGCGI
jgi:hypothetical protein